MYDPNSNRIIVLRAKTLVVVVTLTTPKVAPFSGGPFQGYAEGLAAVDGMQLWTVCSPWRRNIANYFV
jgi:hypothetical protein